MDKKEEFGEGANKFTLYSGFLPQETKYELDGSHAVVLLGFNDIKGYFTVLNSWGKEWGQQGLCHISYEYIRQFSTEVFAVKPTLLSGRDVL